MNSLKYIKGELSFLGKGGSRDVDMDWAINNLKNVKNDLEILFILKKHLAFYSSENPNSEWCDLIGLGNIPAGELDKRTTIEYEKVKKWYRGKLEDERSV